MLPVESDGAKRKRKRTRKEKTHLKFGDDEQEGDDLGEAEEEAPAKKVPKEAPVKVVKEAPAKVVKEVPVKSGSAPRAVTDFRKISALKGKISMKSITDMLDGGKR